MDLVTQHAIVFDYPLLHSPQFQAHSIMHLLFFKLLLYNDIYLLLLNGDIRMIASILTLVPTHMIGDLSLLQH